MMNCGVILKESFVYRFLVSQKSSLHPLQCKYLAVNDILKIKYFE